MRKRIALTSCFLVLILGGVLYAFQAPPTIAIMPANPSTVYTNSTTTVTITAQITDPRVVTAGVNLVQVNPTTNSQTVVGNLSDTDRNNSATFAITFQPVSITPQLYTYEVSAAFRGLLKRSVSALITVAVAPLGVTLPQDPGPAGMQTLAGIDSDSDGVRDDIERWIAVTYPNSSRVRAALTQATMGIQAAILAGGQSQSVAALNAEVSGDLCLAGLMGNAVSAGGITDSLDAIALNTSQRINSYLASNSFMSGTATGLPSVASRTSLCSFDPTSLPN